MNKYEYGAFGCTLGICLAMLTALGLVAAIAIVQGQDAEAEQRLREANAKKSRAVNYDDLDKAGKQMVAFDRIKK
jgi:cyclopropane fatty-acyl-phospholipid synthase-like methyltransferase